MDIVEKGMLVLDDWVSKRGNGKYIEPDFTPADSLSLVEEYGMQQVRSEIEEFAKAIVEKTEHKSILEIGFGFYGSTHFLWRKLFEKVYSLEIDGSKIKLFGKNTRDYYGKWILDDNKSFFIIGSSSSSITTAKTFEALKEKVDVLFIDGDHHYHSVLSDWLLYSRLVKKGGIVAFHDPACYDGGWLAVPKFLEKLKSGEIDGRTDRVFYEIIKSKMGIAYYIND